MESKTIMFVKAWMEPLRQLSAEQRWNVMEAIMEYDSTGTLSFPLGGMENMAFTFIRAEIDRMKAKYREVCDKRREAANSRWTKRNAPSKASSGAEDDDAGECKCISDDANNYKKEKETDTDTEYQTILRLRRSRKRNNSKKTSPASSPSPSSTPYDDSMLLDLFFAPENQASIESIAVRNNLPVAEVRRMAEEITAFWALTDRTHSSYSQAASHLVFSICDQAVRERRQAE